MVLLQEAQLYAHTCPVKFIHDRELLGSSDSFNDALGVQNIWERIKKAGADMFYRVSYGDSENEDEISDSKKRRKDKKYVEDSASKNKLVNTSVAGTDYIKNVIDVFFRGNDGKQNLEKLYHEPGEIGYQ